MIDEDKRDYRRYLDPKVLAKVSGLSLQARMIVEGFFSGMHHSPHRGASVEFADHRAYTQGDDLRHIDWKVYGKTDKYYIKEYEQETNLDLLLVVDGSESMDYRSEASGLNKFEYATAIAAAISYLALQQQDSVGLALIDERLTHFIKPTNAIGQWRTISQELASFERRAGTRLGPILHELTERLPHRMLIILISDLFDDVDEILHGLKHLRYRRHELIVWNLWDIAELTFPFKTATMFMGLEDTGKLSTDPRSVRLRYLDEVERFRSHLRSACGQMQADLAFFDTSMRLDVALSNYLATRSARLRQRSSRILGGA